MGANIIWGAQLEYTVQMHFSNIFWLGASN